MCYEGCSHIGSMHRLNAEIVIGPTLALGSEGPFRLGHDLALGPMPPPMTKDPLVRAVILVVRPQRVALPVGTLARLVVVVGLLR